MLEIKYYLYKKNEMIGLEDILITSGSIKALLLLLSPNLLPKDNLDDFLNNDGIDNAVMKNTEKKFLIIELEKVKKYIREEIQDKTALAYENGIVLSAIESYNLVNAYKNRIQKLRILINNYPSFISNLHKPSGVKYIVARSYWINDTNGKKVRKFAKNLGSEEKVLVNGKIPEFRKEEARKELDRMMWQQYKTEYKV